jgi:L-threonylcarbamoyladenylate synthase
VIATRVQSADPHSISNAAELLRAGELLAFPTETVYGLGADARRTDAVQKIYDAKGRPAGNPVIVHIAHPQDAQQWTADWPPAAQRLADTFWPGPLTLILPRGPALSPLVSAGRATVALRCPNHPVAHALLHAFDGPIAAPSANRSGFTSPTTAAHVLSEFAGRIPLILDGGPSSIGLESTVLDLSSTLPTILRPGAITLEMLRGLLPTVRSLHSTVATTESAPSPGLHSRHYAPRTPAYRFDPHQWPTVLHWLNTHSSPVVLISHDHALFLEAPHETLLMPTDPADYAHNIYAALRDADAKNPTTILVLMPDTRHGLWAAVADRLSRATQPLPTTTASTP